MSRQEEFVAPTVEAALAQAAAQARRSKEELRYEVVREERGFLGVGTKAVAIRVEMPETADTRPEPVASPLAQEGEVGGEEARFAREWASGAPPAAPRGRAEEEEGEGEAAEEEEAGAEGAAEVGPDPAAPHVEAMVLELVQRLGMDLSARMTEEASRIVVDLAGPDRDLVVARRGEALDALQYLLNRMARRRFAARKRIQLESGGFRSDREEEIRDMALAAAERARRTGEIVRLPPLNPYERRIVHVTLSRRPGIATESEGEGFVKRVAVRSLAAAGGGVRRRRGRGRSAKGRSDSPHTRLFIEQQIALVLGLVPRWGTSFRAPAAPRAATSARR
jgi:spoIIIJ-associated protein